MAGPSVGGQARPAVARGTLPRVADDARNGTEDRNESERVEQLFEQWSRRLGRFVAGTAARAREEAEDIFAEAQSIRRGERD